MKIGRKVGIVCCSNGQLESDRTTIQQLDEVLRESGLVPIYSKYIYRNNFIFSGTAKERATTLNEFYENDEIDIIFDISGGDIANELLPYLDYNLISNSKKEFWGYSDLTTIINAIYTKTGKGSVLYQVKNLVFDYKRNQIENFNKTIIGEKTNLYQFDYEFIQGNKIQGVVVGGNIRCLLKLAGTEYWPKMKDKILFLESFSGTIPQITTYLCQLQQLRVFEEIKGLILGCFTKLEVENSVTIIERIKPYIREELPMIKTEEIGHSIHSKAIEIGKEIMLEK